MIYLFLLFDWGAGGMMVNSVSPIISRIRLFFSLPLFQFLAYDYTGKGSLK